MAETKKTHEDFAKETKETKEDITEEKNEEAENEKDKAVLELQDKLLRLTAEYDNYRKRTQKEKDSIYLNAKADTVGEFLTLMDNIEKAVSLKPEKCEGEWKAFSAGVDLMKKQMDEILKSLGVNEISALGETFDPELHNAVMHIEDEESGEGVVVEEFQKGYKIGDRVIRHSVVKVAN